MIIENDLFNLIKNHKYDKFIKLIKENPTIELNEIDDTNTYLIQYAILFRQKDIVALLISRNCKLDILDSDGRSIFYIPIKYGYTEIINILINFSNITIGIPLLEMQDKYHNIPLHYAIIFNKIDIIEDILKIKSNINFKDLDGNTALHLYIKYIKSNNTNILDLFLNNNISINNINNLGQNALHIATEYNNIDICLFLLNNNIDINVETLNNQLTPLIIATIQNNYKLCSLFMNYNVNLNIQDVYGNSVLMYSIINKSKELIELYYDKIDINLTDINGNCAINLFFKYNYDINKLDDFYFDEILKKSKLNIQNNEGNTLWHYLVEYDIWYNYKKIIKKKKNKIFIKNIKNISPYDILLDKFPNKKNKFLKLIAKSFYYHIKDNVNKYNIDLKCDLSNKKDCIKEIKKYIIDKNMFYYDKKKSYCVTNINLENIKFSSYTGTTLDILCGLLYIKNKFSNISTTLTDNFIYNDKLNNHYVSSGINKGNFDEFLNFEIIWSYQKFFYPNNLKFIIDKFLEDNSKEYLIIPLGIELHNGAHANILLYDKNKNELERFEPYGKSFPPSFNYIPKSLDIQLENLFKNYFTDTLKYFKPSDYEPKIGLQLLDIIENSKEKNIGDPGGFCAAWSLWYCEMRITNINIYRINIINKLINYIRNKKVSFRTIIRSYTKNITDTRDKLLDSVDIDINIWLNETYDINIWNNLVTNIKKLI